MKIGVFKASFDPITASEIAFAKRMRKTEGYDLVLFQVEKDGCLPRDIREKFVALAIHPYRHFALTSESEFSDTLVYERAKQDEEAVRNGQYRKAAHGIRAILAEDAPYAYETLNHMCKKSRRDHSYAVAELSRDLAKAHGLDEDRAWKAGMFHDLTKNLSDEEGRQILEIHDPDKLEYSPKVWHSFTAPLFLKRDMGVTDAKLLTAVYCHTLGDGHSDLDRILYIADKTEPTRGYDSTFEVELSKKDLQKGFALVKQEADAYREKERENV